MCGGATAHDRRWAAELRAAACCTSGLLAVMLLVDFGNGTLAAPRAACWSAVALVLFAILCPSRVSAGENWLAVRGLLRTRRVRTDLLTLIRRSDGMAPRLVLIDALGARAEFDPKVLTANPVLWHLLERAAHRSLHHGHLRSGSAVLNTLAHHIDHDGARDIFDRSGMP